MHLSSCLHPKIILNRYTGEKMQVPCGKCDACLNLRSYMWSQKISDESKNWKYMIFVTLTYDDNYVPLLVKTGKNELSSVYRERIISIRDKKKHSFEIDDKIIIHFDPKNDFERDYYRSRKFYPYVRFKDVQHFIKRLRRKIDYYANKNTNGSEVLQSQKIIYFFASEYGSETFRGHYHGIVFTDSDFVAKNFRLLLSESWKFGNSDFSYARSADKSASYVAKYCCKPSDLPSIYSDDKIKPFHTFSRSFPFGACILTEEQIRQIFLNSSPVCPRYDAKTSTFVDVPLYKSVENRLFPLLRGFDNLSRTARNQLYGIVQSFSFCRFGRFKQLCSDIAFGTKSLLDATDKDLYWRFQFNQETVSYIKRCLMLDRDRAKVGKDDDSSLKSLYYLSRKIVRFCINYNYSIDFYVSRIDLYYKNKDAYRLKNQLAFEEEYSKYHPLNDLVWLYPVIVDDLNNGICVSVDSFDYYFNQESFKFVPLQQTFDWQVSSCRSAELRKQSLKTEAVNQSFEYNRFSTTISHFEII